MSVSYRVKDRENQKKIVENAMDPLSGKRPNGHHVSQETNATNEEDEKAFGDPLEKQIIIISRFTVVTSCVIRCCNSVICTVQGIHLAESQFVKDLVSQYK